MTPPASHRRSRAAANDTDPDPDFERRRLAALDRLKILDTSTEREFDDLVLLASHLFQTPIALVSLVAGDRQWFKARVGLEPQETSRDVSFCNHAIRTPAEVFVVEDATGDPRFADNPLVTGDPSIRFYAGAAIVDAGGYPLGTVCVIDREPGTLDAVGRQCLQALASHASQLVKWRGEALAATRSEAELIERTVTLTQDVESRTLEIDRLWERSEDLLATIDGDFRLQRVSPSWNRILGLDDVATTLQPLVALVHDDEHELVREALTRCLAGRLPVAFECRLVADDGSLRWFAWTWTPDPDAGHGTGVGRDITEARKQQAALEATEAALRQSQKMEALGQLTGGLAHDFNNLLTGITGSLELMQLRVSQGRVADLDRYLIAAQTSAKRAAALTHRLLAFSRRQTLDPKATDVNRLVAGMEEMIRRTVGPHIVVDVASGPNPWSAMVDANQLENALLNLCINARDAMPEGGRLTIATANQVFDPTTAGAHDLAPGQYLALCVTDTGTGMDDEVKKRAFDPFFTTKPLGAGTGLGLSMVYGFARQSGGQVHIDSRIGRGTTISLYLPRNLGDVVEVNDGTWSPLATGVGHDEMVLIVDDEPTVRMLIVEVLEDLGYRSLEAQDGASALKLLQSDARVDLLVTDVGLPGGLNGRQVADAARTLRPELKVLFITGYAETAAAGRIALDDAMQVLTKPFSLEDLSARINDMLHR